MFKSKVPVHDKSITKKKKKVPEMNMGLKRQKNYKYTNKVYKLLHKPLTNKIKSTKEDKASFFYSRKANVDSHVSPYSKQIHSLSR